MSSGYQATRRSPTRLRRRGAASPELATRLRRELADWVRGIGVSAETVRNVVQSTYEAMANAVTHAYPRGTVGALELRAHVDDGGDLVVTVADHGCWRAETERPRRGLGLRVIRTLAGRANIVRGDFGTTVWMVWPDAAARPRS